MEMETKIQRAINVIEKRPGIRTDELARAIGVEPSKVAPLIFAATSNGFIATCKVERPGKAPTNEYRLSSSVVASDWDDYRSAHTAQKTLLRKTKAYRRENAGQLAIPSKVVAVPDSDLENRIEGMAEQIADLQVALDVAQQTIHRMELEAEQHGSVTHAAPIGYLVRAPKRDPRLLTQRERAIEAAQAAAKTTGRADVLALVPVGTARRRHATTINWIEN